MIKSQIFVIKYRHHLNFNYLKPSTRSGQKSYTCPPTVYLIRRHDFFRCDLIRFNQIPTIRLE